MKIILDLFPSRFRHAISPSLGKARGKFDPGLFPASALHCRRSINNSDFCLSYFPAARIGRIVLSTWRSSGTRADKFDPKVRFDMWSACSVRARTVEHLDLSSGFASVKFGERE